MTTGCATIVALCIRAAGAPLRGAGGRANEWGAHKTWPMRWRLNLFVFAGPFFKFGPAGTDKGLRVRHGHLNRAIPADIDDPTRPGLHLPCYAGGRSQANPKALGVLIALAALLRLLGPHLPELEAPLARERALEPVEELRCRVDLIVVLARGKTVISCRYSASHGAVSGM